MASLEMDEPFTYLSLVVIIIPQLVLLVLYFIEKACRNLKTKKLLWIYNYNTQNEILEKYFIPFQTFLVYVLAFLIPVYFRNVLGILYLLFILARSYLSIRSRINLISLLIILFYHAYYVTRKIWPNESLYASFVINPKKTSLDFILAILLVDLLHDLGSFIHMYIKLKKKHLEVIRTQSSIYKNMIMTNVKQSRFKDYYMRNFERIVNLNYKPISSKFVTKYFDYQMKLNSVFVDDEIQNQLYDEDENFGHDKSSAGSEPVEASPQGKTETLGEKRSSNKSRARGDP